MTILPYALGIGLIAITISMFLCLIRLIIGPSVIDRLLALDTLFLNATCLVVVLGIYWVSNNMFENLTGCNAWLCVHSRACPLFYHWACD